ncbi:hypothetical protein DL93DRAFT_2171299 [Clavulina sp. PMI_390]|nr:hypothetical protein DL93DRAFT_2171299 [Clavulina sp. PMI_390]
MPPLAFPDAHIGGNPPTAVSINIDGPNTVLDDRGLPPEYTSPHQQYRGPSAELIAILVELDHNEIVTNEKIKSRVKQALVSDSSSLGYTSSCTIEFCDIIDKVAAFLRKSYRFEHQAHSIIFYAEAVRLQRALSGGMPFRQQADLARFLRHQSNALHENSRNADACALDEEALAISRECYSIDPEAERSHLASTLHIYSVHLFYEQKWTEALQMCEEAVILRRLLYGSDSRKHMEGLAASL